jgi:signal transduction histidine kinase
MKPSQSSSGRTPINTLGKSRIGVQSTATTPILAVTDVAEHNRQQTALREEAVLNERGRIAAEIHDTVVQGLNAIVVQVEAAEEEFLEDPLQTRQRLRRVYEVARESLAEARRSVWTLSRESFDNEDLAAALAFLAQRLFDGTAIRLKLHLEEDGCRLTPEIRLGLLRIGQEALVNVRKHAQASKVRVNLRFRKHDVQLSVSDDGKGFLPHPLSSTGSGFGLFSLQSRAEHLGGKVMVRSRPSRGTNVVATIPFHLLPMGQAA